MTELADLAQVVVRVAYEQPLYRLETRAKLLEAADVLILLGSSGPKGCAPVPASASESPEMGEAVEDAVFGSELPPIAQKIDEKEFE